MAYTMVPVTDWLSELTVAAPGGTQEGYLQALRQTLREFTVDSGAWLRELGPITMAPGKGKYTITPQHDADVLYIHSVAYVHGGNDGDGTYTRNLRPQQVPAYRLRSTAASSSPMGFYGDPEESGVFYITPPPNEDVAGELVPYVSLGLLSDNCDQVPAQFKRVWFDIILDGTLGRLTSQQDKPYTNTMAAQYHIRRFRNGIAKARDVAHRQFTSAESAFLFPAWA